MLPTPAPLTPEERAAPTAEFKGRTVSAKQANRPMLVHQRHKAKMAATAAAAAAASSSLPKQPAPGAGAKSGRGPLRWALKALGTTITYSVLVLVASLLLSKAINETWFWGYDGKYVRQHYWFPPPQTLYTPATLARYDGADASQPLLLGLDGAVYDVSGNRGMYGPGGSYHHFAGRDAARAFVTGCFKTGLTHDLRGLSDAERKRLDYWKSFFDSSPKYPKVGRVVHPPIDPASPLPPPCNAKSEGGAM